MLISSKNHLSDAGKKYRAMLAAVGGETLKILGHAASLLRTWISRMGGNALAALEALESALLDRCAKISKHVSLSSLLLNQPLECLTTK